MYNPRKFCANFKKNSEEVQRKFDENFYEICVQTSANMRECLEKITFITFVKILEAVIKI